VSPAHSSSTQGDPAQSEPPRSNSAGFRSSRRAVLAAVGTTATSTLAGCSALGDNSDKTPFHEGDWRSYGNGPANANRVSSGAPEADDYDILASVGWPYTPPVVQDGVVYFAADRRVVAVTPDGDEQWERRLDIEVSGAPALDRGRSRLYVPTRVVRTSDAPDRKHWRISSVHAVEYSSPVIAAGRTFVVGPTGLVALKPGEND